MLFPSRCSTRGYTGILFRTKRRLPKETIPKERENNGSSQQGAEHVICRAKKTHSESLKKKSLVNRDKA